MITAQTRYWINFLRSIRKCCLSLKCNGSNSFLFVNATKIYQFKAKDSNIKKYPLCLGNISKDFTANNIKKKQDQMDMSKNVLLIIILLILAILSVFINYLMKKQDIK